MPFHSPFNFPFFNYRYPRYIHNSAHPELNRKLINDTMNKKNSSATNSDFNNITKCNSSSANKNSESIYLEHSNNSSNYSRDKNCYDSAVSTDSSDFSDSDIDSEPFFEILGLKLYYDDILIICILFFLYSEGVKDDELFISLILLLLT